MKTNIAVSNPETKIIMCDVMWNCGFRIENDVKSMIWKMEHTLSLKSFLQSHTLSKLLKKTFTFYTSHREGKHIHMRWDEMRREYIVVLLHVLFVGFVGCYNKIVWKTFSIAFNFLH